MIDHLVLKKLQEFKMSPKINSIPTLAELEIQDQENQILSVNSLFLPFEQLTVSTISNLARKESFVISA